MGKNLLCSSFSIETVIGFSSAVVTMAGSIVVGPQDGTAEHLLLVTCSVKPLLVWDQFRHNPITREPSQEMTGRFWTDERKKSLRIAVSNMPEDKISWAEVAEQVIGVGKEKEDNNKCRCAYNQVTCLQGWSICLQFRDMLTDFLPPRPPKSLITLILVPIPYMQGAVDEP